MVRRFELTQSTRVRNRNFVVGLTDRMEDVERLHADVREKGYETTDLVDRFYGMKEFEMLDPSGHVLVFGQETDAK
jgi:uncharacterized glyoxalase superfamily protein PhnB